MDTRPLHPAFGVEVLHIDLAEQLPPAQQVLDLLDEHAVLLFRRQCLHDDDLFRFSASLGPVEEPAAYWDHSPDFKEINYIGNLNSPIADVANRWAGTSSFTDGAGLRRFIGKEIAYGPQGFHSDQMFRQHPATLSTLFCVVAPHQGGGTSFCSSVKGYEALPPDLKQEAHALSGRYFRADVDPPLVAEHPLVLMHPTRNRRALYLRPGGTELVRRGGQRCDAAEAERLSGRMMEYQLKPEHRFTHSWRMGDLVVYDNAQVLHKKEAFKGGRLLKSSRVFMDPARFAVPGHQPKPSARL